MKSHILNRAALVVVVMALFTLLGTRGLNEPDEGRFAEIAREMSLSTEWVMPHLGGIPHLQKPPMIYWLCALSIRAFGANEWAVRLPTALAALGTVLAIMHLAGLLFGTDARWKAGLILVSSLLFFVLARLTTTDMLLTFFITTAITLFVHYTLRRRITALLLFHLCLGFGFLTKGPMGFLVPLCAVIPWAIAHGRRHDAPAWRWHWWLGLPLALAVGLSWFVLLIRHNPHLLDYFYRYEFIDRIATNVHKRSKPLWYYSMILIGTLMPWTFIAPRVAREAWSRARVRRTPVFWLCAGWLLLPLLILHAVTSKLPTYLLPLFPPLALVLAHGWQHGRTPWAREIRWLAGFKALLLGAAPVVLWATSLNYRGNMVGVTFSFVASCALLSVCWLVLCLSARPTTDADRLLLGTAGLMLATLLALVGHVDHFLRGGNASLRPIAAAVRAEEAIHGPAQVFSSHIQAYGLDFYLQRIVARTVPESSLVLPVPPDIAPLVVKDAATYLTEGTQQNLLVLIKDNRFATDPLFAGWRQLAQSGSMVLAGRQP
jgi:4-amino-4-deoxy-L-arabinose transferase-like glycosyltransferase